MHWQQLMSSKRYRGEGHPAAEDPIGPDERSPFVKDSDRIVFCKQFRRLQDKTQVHPAPRMDVVRTRLTHSLEASSVGRSLRIAVGKKVLAGPEAADLRGLEPGDFGSVVAAACLATTSGTHLSATQARTRSSTGSVIPRILE
jgi:dGTPase